MEIISVENWGKLVKKQQTIVAELYKIGEKMELCVISIELHLEHK
jgi:hypothetical protein